MKYPSLSYVGDVYRPSDDTWLIIDTIENRNPRGDLCLDLGSGSGVLGLFLLLNNLCRRVVFVDISEDAVESTKLNTLLNNVMHLSLIVLSDEKTLRERSIDVVLSNPPYLPIRDPGRVDIAVEGGLEGYETVLYFIEYASEVLVNRGLFYLVYSSLSRPEYIVDQLGKRGFNIEYSNSRRFFFETIYVVECVKSW